MIDEIAQADPARDAAPTAAEGARMDIRLHGLLAEETRPAAAPRKRPRRALVLVPVALATTAVTLGVALPGGKTPAIIQPAPASAATVLSDLQGKVAGAAGESGRYAYLKQISYTSHMGQDYVAVIPHESEQWIDANGDGVGKELVHDDQATFPTPADKLAWKGKPRPPYNEEPYALDNVEVIGLSMKEIKALPTDPVQLRTLLENRDNVIVTAYAGALLSFAGTPQEVKVALYGVLRSLPGAELIPKATDPLKRTGVGIQFDDEAWRTLFLFDPDTGELLGTKSIGKKEVPGRTIEDWTLTVESGRTDTAPEAKPVTPQTTAR
ncbi:CU044_5270 family protein [Solirubrobacter sp. CPCC 204708]|uniref:CU044_5270 family protein n=1 Tax=Solirubrobacter deserti TaxID=2282478 RepID=A0ABT4RUP9_9ACTN|nr:CU044_5270 family protein [Solirubrobacter deserti]MBE2317922.1 CU044_5270 family protein [Solirubrobacter deserti]MDA0142290.1 CU044_5270 family protein [Solirubrobacter deserti]